MNPVTDVMRVCPNNKSLLGPVPYCLSSVYLLSQMEWIFLKPQLIFKVSIHSMDWPAAKWTWQMAMPVNRKADQFYTYPRAAERQIRREKARMWTRNGTWSKAVTPQFRGREREKREKSFWKIGGKLSGTNGSPEKVRNSWKWERKKKSEEESPISKLLM